MEYRDFVEQVKNQIQDFLPVKFADATVEVNQVVKNNDCVLDGLLIKTEESNIAPTIYLNPYYKQIQDGAELDDVLTQIADVYQSHYIGHDMDMSAVLDYEKIKEYLKNNKVKLIEIQRSKGYSTRKSLTIDKVEKAIKVIREVDKEVIIMVDNCYCEFVETKTPCTVGADIIVGSLIKNLGGGIAPNGAYIAGRHDLVELAGERLTCPGEGREVGPTLGINKQILQGLYLAPKVVASSLKTAVLTSKALEDLNYNVEPKYNEPRADIVQNIIFNDSEKLIKYVQGIQMGSPVDSASIPIPWDMPGYEDQVIMASGAFTQGSSIELSCDGPIRAPYIAYQQGGLTYEYGFLGIARAIEELKK